MKLLYIGCHGILEYDELRLFSQIEGLELFSVSKYFHPGVIWNGRPPLSFPVDCDNYAVLSDFDGKWNNDDFLNRFDVIYMMHRSKSIIDNWKLLCDRKVILRTIGQSSRSAELEIQELKRQNPNLKIVRYSPAERRHENYAGEDTLIRFSKNPNDYGPWNGNIKKVVSVVQRMKARASVCGWHVFSEIAKQVPCQLVGNFNDDVGNLWIGKNLSYDELIKVYNDYRVYLYTGTQPASYCLNFIEAWMSGIPVVALGPGLGNGDENLYEVHDLITNGVDGYWSDSYDNLGRMCSSLMGDDKLASTISKSGRARAIQMFGEEKIKPQWEEFFKTL